MTTTAAEIGPKKAIPRGLDLKVLRDVVSERAERARAVRKDKTLIQRARQDLSHQFYVTRKRLDADGYDVGSLNDSRRKVLHAEVKAYCDKVLHVKRHQIGIFAADRAQFAFRGKTHNVNLESITKLQNLGTDIILVEKESAVEQFVPFTTDTGIALLQSQGFLSEYTEILAKKASGLGANMGVLNDFDIAGVKMGLQFPVNAVRFGMDLQVVSDLGMNYRELEESGLTINDEPTTHWLNLNKLLRNGGLNSYYHEYLIKYLPYLRDKRIELNTVIVEMSERTGSNEALWNWLKDSIIRAFPTRNYNRAVEVYDIYYPNEWWSLKEAWGEKISNVLSERVQQIRSELKSSDEWIGNIEHKESEIEDELVGILLQDMEASEIINDMVTLTRKIEAFQPGWEKE
jgi:hypothetical protein